MPRLSTLLLVVYTVSTVRANSTLLNDVSRVLFISKFAIDGHCPFPSDNLLNYTEQ